MCRALHVVAVPEQDIDRISQGLVDQILANNEAIIAGCARQ